MIGTYGLDLPIMDLTVCWLRFCLAKILCWFHWVRFLLAYMRTGASILNYSTELPIEFVDIMQAILILLIAGEQFLVGAKNRIIFASSKAKNRKEAAQS